MRQNPIISSRVQVGGRQMPSWFSASLIKQARATPPPPPLPTEPPPADESEYEEIDHMHSYTNMNVKKSAGGKRSCSLCGNPNPVVRCEMCNSQIFCGSCNDMYHRHPKRHNHVRKLLESLENRPPLPPKSFLPEVPIPTTMTHAKSVSHLHMPSQMHSTVHHQPPAQLPGMMPVPPPRRQKRFGMRSATGSPTSARKVLFGLDPMGSLKRFVGGMGQRPLPSPPKPTGPPLPPKSDLTRPMTPTPMGIRGNNQTMIDRRHSSPLSSSVPQRATVHSGRNIPLTVLEIQSARNQSVSVANLSDKHPSSHDSGYRDWEDEDDFFNRQRANSVSTSQLSRYPAVSSSNASHFATLQRPTRTLANQNAPQRPPPPVPPRHFSSQLSFQSSQSVFDLDRMTSSQNFGTQWMQPGNGYPQQGYEFQQTNMMGYPGTLHRTPSNSSMGGGHGHNQAFHNWGAPKNFNQPMSQNDMEREMMRVRMGSEPPPYGNQDSMSNPVTPQGSFRKKPGRPGMDRGQGLDRMNANTHNQQPPHHQRPPTPNFGRNVSMNNSNITKRHLESEEDSYFSADRKLITESDSADEVKYEITEDPDGPWSCEHCTFVNPKSTKVCTICCKTPSDGYRNVLTGKNRIRRRSGSRMKDSIGIQDEIPVVKSKLSFSRTAEKQHVINFSVEPMKKRPPTPSKQSQSSMIQNDSENDVNDEQDRSLRHQRLQPRFKGQKPFINSNEDVYGSVPLQTLTISPKIDIRRPAKVSTAVGSSPPRFEDTGVGGSPPPPQQNSSRNENRNSKSYDSNVENEKEIGISSSLTVATNANKSNIIIPTRLKVSSTSTSTSTSTVPSTSTSSQGIQTSASSSSGSSASSTSSFPSRNNKLEADKKSSKGTSPPPQSISTQTYEEMPASKMRQQSSSKQSILSLQSEDSGPPKIEMSEKALRYARKAQHQHQTKLKRSMSTHLTTSTADPWVEPGESRHLYRSSSRHSLASDTRSLPLSGPPSRDPSPPSRGGRFYEDFRRFPPPSWDRFPSPGDYFASIEDLVTRKRRESMRSQEFELTRLLKEAEEFNYTPEDVQVALRMCGERNPIKWLQENWSNMIETVQTLATKYGREKGLESNEVGTISSAEAKEALRVHRGNVWAAVTECVEQRRKKFLELQARGNFLREDILTALTANHGNLDAAYVELSKAQLKPFLMRIWGPPSGLDNEALPPSPSVKSLDLDPLVTSAPIMSLMEKMKPYTDSQYQVKSLFESSLLEQSVSKRPKGSPEREQEDDEEIEASDSQGSSEEEEDEEVLDDEELESEEEEELEIEMDEPDEEIQIENLHSEPRLEKLVSDAERVTMEIERAIHQLKNSAGDSQLPLVTDDTMNASVTAIQAKLESLLPIIAADTPVPQVEIEPQQPIKTDEVRKASIESANIIKSDGEDAESFADAISEEDQNIITASTSPVASDPHLKLEDVAHLIMDGDIDESEALVSDFIQNFEIDPPKPPKVKPETPLKTAGTSEEKKADTNLITQEESIHQSKQGEGNESLKETQLELQNRVLSPNEIEQILSSLVTSNFSSMGQFATDIKEKIATEIQAQLAAAATATTASKSDRIKDESISPDSEKVTVQLTETEENDVDDIDKAYEPITLPKAVTDNVNKKMAKYERLAAKKKQKVVRRKSPESSATKTSSSGSPSPSTSLSHLARVLDSPPDDSIRTVHESQISELDVSDKIYSDVIVIPAEETPKETPEETPEEKELVEEKAVEDEGEGFSVYEEVEMGKSESITTGSDQQRSNSVDDIDEQVELESDEEVKEVEESEEKNNFADVNQIYEEVELSIQSIKKATPLADKESTEEPPSNNNKPIVKVESVIVKEKSPSPVPENEAQIQRLLGEGLSSSYERAELAVQLMEMSFTEEDSVYAANECSSLYSALSFLQQECDLCAGKFSARQMVSMLKCTHWCCRSCAQEYFQVQVRDKPIIDATCPFCKEPSNLTEDVEQGNEYFNHLDILLKNLLDSHHHEMFQRKLRDWTLAKTPNFKWCSKCSSGFITEPLQTRLVCPDCSAVTCAICLQPWEKNHDHRDSNIVLCDAGEASKCIADYLNENCVECPRCHYKFALSRGGCMHLTCTQCRHEFCSGCSATFKMGTKCEAKFAFCDKLGLHAHHPRNCLFYLRDKEPEILVKLLEEHSIPYLKESSEDADAAIVGKKRRCQVPVQRETENGLEDGFCEKTAPFGCAKVCLPHYVEYLGLLIWQNHLDPVSILSNGDLETIIRRANKKMPGRIPFGISDEEYRPKLLKVISDDVPL